MNFIHSIIDPLRDRYAPVSHNSTFRSTGQITPEEFVAAGDFLVYKFPSWAWSDAAHPSRRVSYLPPDKQFLVTRGVPCHRRLDDDSFTGGASAEDLIIKDGLGPGAAGKSPAGEAAASTAADGDDDGWLRTGGGPSEIAHTRDVRTLDGSGNVGERDEHEQDEDEIPDMEDDEDDDEAIIRDSHQDGKKASLRNYTIYITYTPYYRTPRLYLSGYASTSEPLPPKAMMEDIVGDYKDKTVTLEDFPFFEPTSSIKMASIHPCRHASVMKVLLDRADAALRLRRAKVKQTGNAQQPVGMGMEGLVDETRSLSLAAREQREGHQAGVSAAGGGSGDEWEVLQHDAERAGPADDSAIRVDQYLVVFIKFVGSVTPTIEHDYTMSV